MAHPTDRLFVYGTLMPATGHPMAARLADESRIIGPGSVPGRLYDFGAWPGAVPSAAMAERVHGTLLRLTDPARSLPWLDAYEGASETDPEPRAFERVIVPVRLMSGRQVDGWIYYYRGRTSPARLIPGGRYAARKALVAERS
jgi:gamma-glutamylcyclotransferase (GGCT)/AIG2-like uncharacterized protein YtfP